MAVQGEEFERLNDFDKYAMLLGHIVQTAGFLEWLQELCLLGLLGFEENYGGAVVRYMPLDKQRAMIKKLVIQRYKERPEDINQILEVLTKVQAFSEARNQHIHARHFFSGAFNQQIHARKGQFEVSVEDVDTAGMVALVLAGKQAANTFYSLFANKVLPEPPSISGPPGL